MPANDLRIITLNIGYGPQGAGAHHATAVWKPRSDVDVEQSPAWEAAGTEEDPAELAAWTEFHAQIERLPEEERDLFDLLWYQGLSQVEAAELLGVSERTVKRRWASARLRLHKVLGGALEECGRP